MVFGCALSVARFGFRLLPIHQIRRALDRRRHRVERHTWGLAGLRRRLGWIVLKAGGRPVPRPPPRRPPRPRAAGRPALACTSEGCDGPGLAARTGCWVGTMSLI